MVKERSAEAMLVKKIMDTTMCDEESAFAALHACGNDLNAAVNHAIENKQDEWVEHVKGGKKTKKEEEASRRSASRPTRGGARGRGSSYSTGRGGRVDREGVREFDGVDNRAKRGEFPTSTRGGRGGRNGQGITRAANKAQKEVNGGENGASKENIKKSDSKTSDWATSDSKDWTDDGAWPNKALVFVATTKSTSVGQANTNTSTTTTTVEAPKITVPAPVQPMVGGYASAALRGARKEQDAKAAVIAKQREVEEAKIRKQKAEEKPIVKPISKPEPKQTAQAVAPPPRATTPKNQSTARQTSTSTASAQSILTTPPPGFGPLPPTLTPQKPTEPTVTEESPAAQGQALLNSLRVEPQHQQRTSVSPQQPQQQFNTSVVFGDGIAQSSSNVDVQFGYSDEPTSAQGISFGSTNAVPTHTHKHVDAIITGAAMGGQEYDDKPTVSMAVNVSLTAPAVNAESNYAKQVQQQAQMPQGQRDWYGKQAGVQMPQQTMPPQQQQMFSQQQSFQQPPAQQNGSAAPAAQKVEDGGRLAALEAAQGMLSKGKAPANIPTSAPQQTQMAQMHNMASPQFNQFNNAAYPTYLPAMSMFPSPQQQEQATHLAQLSLAQHQHPPPQMQQHHGFNAGQQQQQQNDLASQMAQWSQWQQTQPQFATQPTTSLSSSTETTGQYGGAKADGVQYQMQTGMYSMYNPQPTFQLPNAHLMKNAAVAAALQQQQQQQTFYSQPENGQQNGNGQYRQDGEQNGNGTRTKSIDLSSFGNKAVTGAKEAPKPQGIPAQAIGMKPQYDANRGGFTAATAGLNTPPPNVAFAQGGQAYNYAMLPQMAMGNAQQMADQRSTAPKQQYPAQFSSYPAPTGW